MAKCPMPSDSVAIIDIGSNSIKVLVAGRAGAVIAPRLVRTVDARISAGISQNPPRLGEEGMRRGVEAVKELLAAAAPHAPARTILVATSAVRDAVNGAEFAERVRVATGHPLLILSGTEEASLIGRGLTTDPSLRAARDFYVFDLGGGSLECLAFRNRKVVTAESLRLGCVRLTEKFVPDPTGPLSAEVLAKVGAHTRETIADSSFRFSLPASAIAVGTGGTVTTVRAILGVRIGKPFDATEATVRVAPLRELLAEVAALPLAARRPIAGLPPLRADVFPVALATLIAIAELGQFTAFQNSLCNLRYGLAAELLGADVSTGSS